MNEWVKEIGQMTALFALSVLVAYLYTTLTRSKPLAGPPLRARLRVRLPGGMARAALISKGPFGWEIGPILQRQGSQKANVGDPIIVEAPVRNGVTLFRSSIASVEGTTMTINPPERVFDRNRRQAPRRTDVEGWPVRLDGVAASLVDLSARGARVTEVAQVEKSQRVELEVGKFAMPCWVVEVCADRSARLLFEEPLDPAILKSKTAPSF